MAKPALIAAPARAMLASGEPPPTSTHSSQPGDMPSDSATRIDQNELLAPLCAALVISPSTSVFFSPALASTPVAASASQSKTSRPLLRCDCAS